MLLFRVVWCWFGMVMFVVVCLYWFIGVMRVMDMFSINVQSIFDDNVVMLKLSWLMGYEGWECGFLVDMVGNVMLSVDFVGYLNLIYLNCIQVFGEVEIDYYQCQIDEDCLCYMVELIVFELLFFVVVGGVVVLFELVLCCMCLFILLFMMLMLVVVVIDSLWFYMLCIFVLCVMLYGVFFDIFGMGVLLIGDLGFGKSEFGFELISCGYGFVVDDVVDFVCFGFDFVEGCCLLLLQNLFEVCGFGLFDIKMIFGEIVVWWKMKLKLIVQFVWCFDGEFQCLLFESQIVDVFGLLISKVMIQVVVGCNFVVFVEVVVWNMILQLCGIDMLCDFMDW